MIEKEKFMGEKEQNASDVSAINLTQRTEQQRRERRRKISIWTSVFGILLIVGWVFINSYFLESPRAHFYASDEIAITLNFDEEVLPLPSQANQFIELRELLRDNYRWMDADDERLNAFSQVISLMRRTRDYYTRGEPLIIKQDGSLTMAQSFRTRVLGGAMLVEVMHVQYRVDFTEQTLTLSRPSWFAFEYDSRRNRVEFINQPRDRASLLINTLGIEFTAEDSLMLSAGYNADITRAPNEHERNSRSLQQGVTIFNAIPANIVAQAPIFGYDNAPNFGGTGEHSYNWRVAGFEINYTDAMYNLIETITFNAMPEDENAAIVARIFINRER